MVERDFGQLRWAIGRGGEPGQGKNGKEADGFHDGFNTQRGALLTSHSEMAFSSSVTSPIGGSTLISACACCAPRSFSRRGRSFSDARPAPGTAARR